MKYVDGAMLATTFMKGQYSSCKTITSQDTHTQQFEKISKTAPTAPPQPQQSSYSQGQKKIDAKFFDQTRVHSVLIATRHGFSKAYECSKKVCNLTAEVRGNTKTGVR